MTSVAPKSEWTLLDWNLPCAAKLRGVLRLAGAEAPTAGTLPPRGPEGSSGRTETNLGAGSLITAETRRLLWQSLAETNLDVEQSPERPGLGVFRPELWSKL
jgi:hypothetical protein